MQGATLVDERPLTPNDVNRRMTAGSPSFTTTPERLTLPTRGVSGNPAPFGVQDAGGFYSQAQMDLSLWCAATPGACDPPDFGAGASDFSGTDDPRTVRALKSFQLWAKGHGVQDQRTDGVLDSPTLILLQEVAGDIAANHLDASHTTPGAQPQASQASFPVWMLGAGALLALLLFGNKL